MSRNKTPQADGPFTLDLDPSYAKQFARGYGMLPEGAKSVLALCKLALDYVLSIFTLPLEVLLLRRMGPRSMTLYRAVQMSVIATRAATFLPNKPAVAFLWVAAAVTWWRFIEARRGEWRASPTATRARPASRSCGRPWPGSWSAGGYRAACSPTRPCSVSGNRRPGLVSGSYCSRFRSRHRWASYCSCPAGRSS